MNVRNLSITTISICGVIAIGFAGQVASYSSNVAASLDSVVASFERELSHSPVPAAPAQGHEIEGDILYRELNSIHWTNDAD